MDIFNYELETRRCSDCKYHRWYKEGKKYGCHSEGYNKICDSFRSKYSENECLEPITRYEK